MKIFYCGDVVGRPGREALSGSLERIREQYRPDILIANLENAAHGYGVTPKIAREFLAKGVDFITLGNHWLAQRDIVPFLNESKRIVRPINAGNGSFGRGFGEFETASGRRILVMQVMGRVFMNEAAEPYVELVEEVLAKRTLGRNGNIDAIFVDIHAETTSEKAAFGHWLDGRVSAVAGTHTHVQTSDARILPNGTAYITDAGMCGAVDSVLGANKTEPIARLGNPQSLGKLKVADGAGEVCGVFVETDDKTGLATRIEAVRIPHNQA